jgi:quinol monooxygenase YgiN
VPEVRLHGLLVCDDEDEAALIVEHLPRHIALTRQEPGCLDFAVERTTDLLVWSVEECFADRAAFDAHQQRVASSAWGRLTAHIERRYAVEGLTD